MTIVKRTINKVVGNKVSKVEKVLDSLQIWFENGYLFNIFNAYEVNGRVSADGAELLTRKLCEVKKSDNSIEFVFEDGITLRIGMRDDDYNGPEAMNCIAPDGTFIVWD